MVTITFYTLSCVAHLLFLHGIDDRCGRFILVSSLFFSVLGIAFSVVIIGVWTTKVVIDDEKISSVIFYGTDTILFTDIKGIRVAEGGLTFVHKDPQRKNLLIDNFTASFSSIHAWAIGTFVDLDAEEVKEKETEILSDASFGRSVDERSAKLEEARKVSRIFNSAGMAIGLWTMLYPKPYDIAISAAIAFPLAGVVLLTLYRGLICVNELKNSAHPTFFNGILFCGLGLMLRGTLDYEWINEARIWYNSITVAFAISIGAFMITGENRKQKKAVGALNIFLFSLILMMYSFGTYIMINCNFDYSKSNVYTTKVISKEIEEGKVTNYHLELAEWGPFDEPEKISVSKRKYEHFQAGDSIKAHLKNGTLGTKWYFVDDH